MSTKTRGRRHPGDASNGELRKRRAKKPAPPEQEVSAEERFRLIQICAYGLWEQAGRPGGDAARERFWCEAETAVLAPQATDE
jgi:hypothetical protein